MLLITTFDITIHLNMISNSFFILFIFSKYKNFINITYCYNKQSQYKWSYCLTRLSLLEFSPTNERKVRKIQAAFPHWTIVILINFTRRRYLLHWHRIITINSTEVLIWFRCSESRVWVSCFLDVRLTLQERCFHYTRVLGIFLINLSTRNR